MSTGEVIQIHIGQAGVQVANACWELYCLEHGINSNGCIVNGDGLFNSFFRCVRGGKVVPRVILVDTEPTVIDEVRTGSYKNLFDPNSLISGKEDSGNNFYRGYYASGNHMIPHIMDTLRATAESCSNLQGFLIFRSIGGGTGSGLGTKILENLNTSYNKKCVMEFTIFPSPSLSPVVVEPYNAVNAVHAGIDYCDCTFLLDNEALYDICSSKLELESPTFTNLNRLIAQVVSAFTAPFRFEGSVNVKFHDFETNLVPFPRIHFPMVSYSPMNSKIRGQHEIISTSKITTDLFDPSNQMIKCNPRQGKYMSCSLLYRGNVSPPDVNSTVSSIKSKLKNFVDWAPSGFKIGFNYVPPTFIPWGDLMPADKACVMLANNTCIRKAWCRLLSKFNRMLARRAYLFHYIGEGMEEAKMVEAKNDICRLVHGYREFEDFSDSKIRASV